MISTVNHLPTQRIQTVHPGHGFFGTVKEEGGREEETDQGEGHAHPHDAATLE